MQSYPKIITLTLFILVGLLMLTGTALAAPPADGPLIPYTEDGVLYGYKNMDGDWAIEPQFDSAGLPVILSMAWPRLASTARSVLSTKPVRSSSSRSSPLPMPLSRGWPWLTPPPWTRNKST